MVFINEHRFLHTCHKFTDDMEKENHTVPKRNQQWLLWVLPAVMAIAVLILYFLQFHGPLSKEASAWGTFGDYFGGLLNPVVAFCTLFVAMRVWSLQESELKATQNALTEQAETARKQRAEQRFFDLMNFYHQTLDGFQFKDATGKKALTEWMLAQSGCIRGLTSRAEIRGNQNPTAHRIDALRVNLKNELRSQWLNPEISNALSHYFRLLFRILTDAKDILGDDHYRFIRLFRAQLSHVELILIGLNLWASPEGKNMCLITAHYGLLKHLPKGDLRTILENNLDSHIFGRRFVISNREKISQK